MRTRCLLAGALLLALFGSAAAQAPACSGAQQRKLVAELLLGRNIGDRLGVSQRDFAQFVDREISRRFPDGATILDASGRYYDAARKKTLREPSKLVMIVLPQGAQDQDKLDAIMTAYRIRFRQQSVGLILREACVSFQTQ